MTYKNEKIGAFIVPTGIGASIGGYAGDASCQAREFAKHTKLIVNPNVDEAGLKALEEKFTGLINENGKVESVENMGKKRLAYEIKKFKEGTYMLFNFEANPDSIKELERVYRITDDIIKFIVVRKED